jgi:predicted DNA-binding transcriptional regulator YafY
MAKARSYRQVIEEGISAVDYIVKEEAKAPRRRPRRVGMKPKAGTLFAIRNKRIAIREAALRKVQVIITYKKTTTNETNKYIVAPYEWSYRRLRSGLRKVLYAYDMKDKHIKSFVQRNIRNVAITDRKFRPKWEIKIR